MNPSRAAPRLIDLSHALDTSTTPFPGDPPLTFEAIDRIGSAELGGVSNSSAVRTSLHCGTHMDAPYHFCPDGLTIDRAPLERCVGPAHLVRLEGRVDEIGARHVEAFADGIAECGRVVFDTGWHRRWGAPDYFAAHPVLSAAAARLLVARGVGLVGVDFPSVDREPYETHRTLLGAGVLIIENLTGLEAVPPGRFELLALPLRFAGRDGSPVRAVARLTAS